MYSLSCVCVQFGCDRFCPESPEILSTSPNVTPVQFAMAGELCMLVKKSRHTMHDTPLQTMMLHITVYAQGEVTANYIRVLSAPDPIRRHFSAACMFVCMS